MKPCALVTCYTEDFTPVADLTVPTHREYAERHGYVYENRIVPKEVVLRQKLEMVYEYLEAGHKAVMWTDADAMVTNMTESLRDLFRANSFSMLVSRIAGVYLTTDVHGLNAGVFAVHNQLLTRQLFYALKGYGYDLFQDRMNPEQQAMRHLLSAAPYDDLVEYVPQKSLNAYWPGAYDYPGAEDVAWQPGDFILHLPAIPNSRRVEIFREAVEKIVR